MRSKNISTKDDNGPVNNIILAIGQFTSSLITLGWFEPLYFWHTNSASYIKGQLRSKAKRLGFCPDMQPYPVASDANFNIKEKLEKLSQESCSQFWNAQVYPEIISKINQNKTFALCVGNIRDKNLTLKTNNQLFDIYLTFQEIYIGFCNEFNLQNCFGQKVNIEARNVIIDNSIINELYIRNHTHSVKIHIRNSWVGKITYNLNYISSLEIEHSEIGGIELGETSENLTLCYMMIKNAAIATNKKQSPYFTGVSSLRKMYKFSEKTQNTAASHFFRGLVLRSEHCNETGFMRGVSWFYGFFGNFGLSPGRTVIFILATLFGSTLVMGFNDVASIAHSESLDIWVKEASGPGFFKPYFRSFILTSQTMLNPFYILTVKQLMAAKSAFWQLIVTFIGFFSLALYGVLILSIRRRFKVRE